MNKKYTKTTDRREFYKRVYSEVGGCCMICHQPERLVIDHNHDTGEMRGLLCYTHNAGLGMFQDDPALLDKAATYLREKGYGPSLLTTVELQPKQDNLKVLINTLVEDFSYRSDWDRARSLAKDTGLSVSACQSRISRLRRRLGTRPKTRTSASQQ